MKIFLYKDRKDVYLDAFWPGGIGRGLPPIGAGDPLPFSFESFESVESFEGFDGKEPLPAALICPGGGYHIIGTTEARPVSDKFEEAGYAAFVLHYTVADIVFGQDGFRGFAPVQDLVAALRLLYKSAQAFCVDPDRIVLAGFSAGGHLCAGACYAGVLSEEGLLPKALVLTYPMGGGPDSGGEGQPQPDFDIAAMPYASDPKTKTLPTFMWHAKDDDMVPFAASERLAARLGAEGMPHTFLAYEHGVHARPFFDPSWFTRALDWLAGI